jgi:hypothetical protein
LSKRSDLKFVAGRCVLLAENRQSFIDQKPAGF